jgi:hypothetical protein
MRSMAGFTSVRVLVQARYGCRGSLLTVPDVEMAKWCPVVTMAANRMKGGRARRLTRGGGGVRMVVQGESVLCRSVAVLCSTLVKKETGVVSSGELDRCSGG